MVSLLLRLGRWLAHKGALTLLILVVGIGSCALYLYFRDHWDLEIRRTEALARLQERADGLKAEQEAWRGRLEEWRAEAERERERMERAGRIIARLQELEDWWSRLFGSAEQRQANAEQIAKLEVRRHQWAGRVAQLQSEMAGAARAIESAEAELRRVEQHRNELEGTSSRSHYYAWRAWEQVRWPLLSGIVLLFLGPPAVKVFLFYGWAALLERASPVRIEPAADGGGALAGESRVSLPVTIEPGEALWIKEAYLQASDEPLRRRTRLLLDWGVPFSSLACGLVELIEMRNSGTGPLTATCSAQENPHVEVAQISVPANASVILRPRFLVGVIKPAETRLGIRRHWRLANLASWISFRFRYFEFLGPCRILLAGTRGIRVEALTQTQALLRRRTNSAITVGFSPGLELRPVRAETFWAYFREKNPLFDDLFSGTGLFLCQESASADSTGAARFWRRLWDGLLSVAGL